MIAQLNEAQIVAGLVIFDNVERLKIFTDFLQKNKGDHKIVPDCIKKFINL